MKREAQSAALDWRQRPVRAGPMFIRCGWGTNHRSGFSPWGAEDSHDCRQNRPARRGYLVCYFRT